MVARFTIAPFNHLNHLAMKKVLLMAAVAGLVAASCSKEFTKKHEAHFKINGTQYNCGEDQVSAYYYNGSSTKLVVEAFAGSSGTMGFAAVLDLTRIDYTIAIDSAEEGFYCRGANSAVQYFPISGEWKITSYKEGNPASRHTEGTVNMVAVNQYDNTDTIRITDGTFYVNNY